MHLQKSHQQCVRFLLVWVLLCALKLGNGQSQPEEYIVETIPFTGELSGYRGTCMLQDRDGFMWFGFEDNGLCRYDGRSFKMYRHNPGDRNSISFDQIYHIIEDREGTIWIATRFGLNRFDKSTESFTHYFPEPGNPASFLDEKITCLLEDSQGYIWIGTRLAFSRFDKSTGTFKPYTLDHLGHADEVLDFNRIYKFYEDKSGTLWIQNGRNGLCKVEKDSDSVEFVAAFPCRLRGIMEDRSGRFWLATDCGLYLFDRDSQTSEQYLFNAENNNPVENPEVKAILEDNQGNLWIRSSDGFYKYNQEFELLFHWHNDDEYVRYTEYSQHKAQYDNFSIYFQHYVLKDELLEDKAGTLWFYTLEGINKLIRRKNHFKVFDPDPNTNTSVQCLYVENRQSIWMGTQNGIYELNTHTQTYRNHRLYSVEQNEPATISENVLTFCQDRMGVLWTVSGDRTLHKIILSDNQIVNASNSLPEGGDTSKFSDPGFYHIFEDGAGRLWIGTLYETPCYYDQEKNKIFHLVPNPLSRDSIMGGSMIRHKTEDKSLLATGWSGIYKIIPPFIQVSEDEVMPSELIQYKPDEGSFESDWIRKTNTSYLDSSGTLWLATNGSGLLRMFEKTGLDSTQLDYETSLFDTSHGLCNNHILSIQDDYRGNLWLGTQNGLSKFDKRSESFTNYSSIRGLLSNFFIFESAARNDVGELFFGTGGGMISFPPDSIQTEPVIAPVKFTELKIHNQTIKPSERSVLRQTISLTDQIELRYNQNYLSIEFASLNYLQPESNRYKYMLVGLDPDWVISGTRNYASYSNLKSGKYIFRVISSNYSGVWNEEGAKLGITIHPPPWLSWWAYAVYAIVILSIAVSFRRWYFNRARLRNALEIERIEKEKAEEIDQMKSRFFANISHEFRTPLTLILGPMEDLIRRRTERLELSRDQATTIHRNSKRLHGLINQLLDISKLETGSVKLRVSEGNVEEFVRTLSLSFLSLAERKRINYEISLPGSNRLILFDPDKLEKILTNLISNAFKFTASGDTVEVSLQFQEVTGDTQRALLELRVSDTGKGIPVEELNKIFDRFYQVSDNNTMEVEGTGIGLALTKELVDLYRGEISVKSEIGKGSTFSVQVPYLNEDFSEEEIVVNMPIENPDSGIVGFESISAETTKLDSNKDLSRELFNGMPVILIVEDNEDMMKYMTDNLKSNHQILTAENGKIGLQKAKEKIPDLIISDVMMPEMDGIEMCKHLRSDQITNHIPIIMLTARADRGSKLEGLETGADDYLIKPFDKEELKVRINNLLEQRLRLREKFRKEFTLERNELEASPKDLFLKRLYDILDQHISDPEFKLEQLSHELHISRSQVYRKIVAISGSTPNELIRNLRLKKAARLFRSGHTHINQVMLEVGYLHQSYFSKCFSHLYGMTPKEYIQQNSS